MVLVELGKAVEEKDWGANVVGDIELKLAFCSVDAKGAGNANRCLCLYCSPEIWAAAVLGLEVGIDQVARHLGELSSRLCRAIGVVN